MKDAPKESYGFRGILDDFLVVIKYKQLLILSFAILVSMIGFGLIMPFLPIYAQMYGATDTQVGLMMGIFAVVRLATSPIGGWLADKIGRKPLMVFGMFLYTVVMYLFGTATTLPELFLYRGGQGAASGLVWPVAMAYVGDIVKEKDRGKAMGLYTLMFATGSAIGPMMGGLISTRYGLAMPFFITSLMALLSGLTLLFGLKESFIPGEQVDKISKKLPKASFLRPYQYLKSITPYPQTFLGISVGSFTLYFGLAALFPMLPIYGMGVLGLSSFEIGILFTVMGVVQMVFMFPSGCIADRVGHKKMIVIGAFIAAVFAGLIVLAVGFYSIIFIVAIYTMGRSISKPSIPALVTSLTPISKRGRGMGIYTFFENFAWAGGSIASGMISDLFGKQYPFIFAMIIGIIGTVIIIVTVVEPDRFLE